MERINQKEGAMHKTLLLLGAGLAGVAVGVGGTTFVSAQATPQITRTEILRKPMSEVANKERTHDELPAHDVVFSCAASHFSMLARR